MHSSYGSVHPMSQDIVRESKRVDGEGGVA
jgi:hypothetical protein